MVELKGVGLKPQYPVVIRNTGDIIRHGGLLYV